MKLRKYYLILQLFDSRFSVEKLSPSEKSPTLPGKLRNNNDMSDVAKNEGVRVLAYLAVFFDIE